MKRLNALVAGGEPAVVHQILPDRHNVAATGECEFERGTETKTVAADEALAFFIHPQEGNSHLSTDELRWNA